MDVERQFHNLVIRMCNSYNQDLSFQKKHVANKDNINMKVLSQHYLNTITKQIPNQNIRICVENTLIDSNISSKHDLVCDLDSQLASLKMFHGSKNKMKKIKKAMKRLNATRKTLIGDKMTNWYNTPTGKNIRVISTAQTLNFLKELAECTGSVLLPSEKYALASQDKK